MTKRTGHPVHHFVDWYNGEYTTDVITPYEDVDTGDLT